MTTTIILWFISGIALGFVLGMIVTNYLIGAIAAADLKRKYEPLMEQQLRRATEAADRIRRREEKT